MSSRACSACSTAPRRSGRRSATCSASTPGPPLRPSQGAQRARPPARARPPRGQATAAPRLGRHRPRAGAGSPPGARLGARPLAPRRRRSLREGLEETVTLTRLGIRGSLKRTLESTNPCESMIDCVRPPAAGSSAGSRRHVPALDRGRHARGRAPVPAHHRLPRPRQARRRARTRPRPAVAADLTRPSTPTEEAATLATA